MELAAARVMAMKIHVRPELGTLPARIAKLPIDPRGYPVPWFVDWIDGPDGPETVPEFRVMDPRKFVRAVKERLCWVCGEKLGAWLAFPIGPMCAITRTTAEPPCHRECAEWSIKFCPFLSEPRTVRRTDRLPDQIQDAAGAMITRNPGVTCLWITRSFEMWNDGHGKPLITVGKPEAVAWWCEGRSATRAEVEASTESGLPILMAAAQRDGPFAIEQLGKQTAAAKAWWPPSVHEAVG